MEVPTVIPLPGVNFVYSVLKDLAKGGLTWLRGRSLQLWARGWTVDDWYHPYDAAEKFGDQFYFQSWRKAYDTGGEDAMGQAEGYERLIREDLNERLVRGELIARGFREPFSHGAPYLTISRHEWLIIKLVPLDDRAQGGGVSYIALRIGKAGTRSIFRRHRQ
jgi:hypothetical protein